MHGSFDRLDASEDQASTSSPPITFAATTFKQRDHWSRMLPNISGLKLKHRDVLRSLALCARLNDKAEIVIDPTYAKPANAARCHKATAIRAVNVAEEIGVIRKKRHSDGRVSNVFELLLPVANGRKSEVPTVANLADAQGSNGRTAATVLRLESKEELKDRVPSITTSESAAQPRALSIKSLLKPREITLVTDAAPSPALDTTRDATPSQTTSTEQAPDAKAPAIEELREDRSNINFDLDRIEVTETPEGLLPLTGLRPVTGNGAVANAVLARGLLEGDANSASTQNMAKAPYWSSTPNLDGAASSPTDRTRCRTPGVQGEGRRKTKQSIDTFF